MTKWHIGEIVDDLLLGHKRHTLVSRSVSASDKNSDRPEENRANDPVHDEVWLVLSLHGARVLPRNSLGVRRVLPKPIGQPGVRLEVLLKPVDILHFVGGGRKSRGFHFKDFIWFSLELSFVFVRGVVIDGLAELVVVRLVVLGWHAYSGFCSKCVFCLFVT